MQKKSYRFSDTHFEIMKEFQRMYPQYPNEADVIRHAILLLDDEMRRNNGQDDLSILRKEVKELQYAVGANRVQMDMLIRLMVEFLNSIGIEMTWEEAEKEIREGIAASVTKKSEKQAMGFSRKDQQPPISKGVKKEMNIKMVSDDEEIVMKDGKPCRIVTVGVKRYPQIIDWEQIPEHRRSELSS